MFRLRFENLSQIFDGEEEIILPVSEILKEPEILKKRRVIGEIPPVIWECNIDNVKQQLAKLSELGLEDVLAENLGAISIAKEFGFKIHGGSTLNILNSVSLKQHQDFGLADTVLSIELSFTDAAKIRADMPVGMICYGYLPMMKFRACPLRGEKGCGNCPGRGVLTDRIGKEFTVICRQKQYSELLNCVPVYVGDKNVPKLDFEVLYFTVESKSLCRKVYELYKAGEPADFERTAGLYYRELQ